MLKNIPNSFTPELLKKLMEMGHGEDLFIADGNFPHKSMNFRTESIYLPISNIAEFLKDILKFFPLDYIVECAGLTIPSATEGQRYGEYSKLIEENGSKLATVQRFDFYELAEKAICVVVTSDATKGASLLLKKGVSLIEGEQPRQATENQRKQLELARQNPKYQRWL